ncbi:MAG: translation initiation factor IF-2 [Pseudomonadota bacterium]
MGKIRVYELAKELNLGNRELLKKLQDFGYQIRSHSSTLEDFQVREIKERIQGKRSQAISEATGRPTVIRRRKQSTAPEPGFGPDSSLESEPEDEGALEGTLADDLGEGASVSSAGTEAEGWSEEAEAEPLQFKGEPDDVEPERPIQADSGRPVEESRGSADLKPGAVEQPEDVVSLAETPASVRAREPGKKVEDQGDDAVVEAGSPGTPPLVDEEKGNLEAPRGAMSEVVEMPVIMEAQPGPDVMDKKVQDAQAMEINEAKKAPVSEADQMAGQVVESTSTEAPPEASAHQEQIKPKERMEKSSPGSGPPKKGPAEPHAPREPKLKQKVKKIEKTTAEPARIISRPAPPAPPPPPAPPVQSAPPARTERPAEPPVPSGRVERTFEPSPGRPPQGRPNDFSPDQGARRRPPFAPSPQGRFERPGGPPRSPMPPSAPVSWAMADETSAAAEARKSKKKKKTKEAASQIEDGARKKIVRRKEIIEKTELYDSGGWERPGRARKAARAVKKTKKTEITVPKAIKRRVKVVDSITVADLAKKMGIKSQDIIKKLMTMGVMAGLNQGIDFETAVVVAADFGYEVEQGAFVEEDILNVEDTLTTDLAHRPPVVTVMGHVDHGKTSLLDAIRKTNVIGGEAGGITQHIGAYHVEVKGGLITFLDTPGHEAFTSMRARGAQITDIVVLVVAADDGVMLQTREAADHARAAGVPIVVAVNKIDKPEADPDRIRRELADLNLVPEAWGGDTIFVELSAKTGHGVEELLELILLQSEMLELKASHQGRAQGRIVEARLDKGRGPVATVLVQSGKLRPGDPFVCGAQFGKIRAMFDDKGRRIEEAGPSIPVEIQGLNGVPQAGDEFVVVEDEKRAKQVSQHRQLKQRESELIKTSKLTLENLFDNIKEGGIKELNLVIKADVQGSLEAIIDALQKLGTEEIKVNIIHSSTGAISETDIMLASASQALVVGFNVRPNAKVADLGEQENIQIRYYDVIYKLIEEIKEAMAGMLEPIHQEHVLGRAEVREAFHVSKVGTIAGSSVSDGKIQRGAKARLIRDDVVIYDGRIISLKRFKDDAKEVTSGYECGIGLENYNDIKIGDIIEAYMIEDVAATLD